MRTGAAGVVYKARHRMLASVYALRTPPAELAGDEVALARLERDLRAAALLRHPNIVRVVDVERDGARRFVVEEFLDATPLEELITARGRFAADEALVIARQLASALRFAHDRGILHGHVSPGTVLVERESPPRALLTDFGMASVPPGTIVAGRSAVRFAPPERLAAEGPVSEPVVDVYGVGMLLFAMCEGRPPFHAMSVEELTDRAARGEALAGPRFTVGVPDAFAALVARATDPDPARRPGSMADLEREIEECVAVLPADDDTMSIPKRRPTPRPSAPKPKPKATAPRTTAAKTTTVLLEDEASGPSPWIAVGALVAVAAVAAAVLLFFSRGEAPAPLPVASFIPNGPVEVSEGGAVTFHAVLREQAAQSGARYEWSVDGVSRTGDAAWRYEAEYDRADRDREVVVGVRAIVGAEIAEHGWPLRIVQQRRPPRIVAASPAGATVEVPTGSSVTLAVEASDPDGPDGDVLRFRWQRDGVSAHAANDARLVVDDVRGETSVSVAVSDRDDQVARHTWTIVPVAAAEPPSIRATTPAPGVVSLAEGESRDFSVTAQHAGGGELAYEWRLDGVPMGTGPRWRFTAPPSEQRSHQVEVTVRDERGLAAPPVTWEVLRTEAPRAEIPPTDLPPLMLTRVIPAGDSLSIVERRPINFEVGLSGVARGGVQYKWIVDGRVIVGEQERFLRVPALDRAGEHVVEVVGVDRAGRQSGWLRWRIHVTPAPVAAESP